MNGRRLEIMAWLVLLAAFAGFVVAAVGIPWLGLQYAEVATIRERVSVERKSGSVKLESSGVTVVLDPGGRQAASVTEGTVVTTQGDGRALLRFFDESTLNLEADTQVRTVVLRRPRFDRGAISPTLVVDVTPMPGRTARLTAGTTWRPTRTVLRLPQGTVTLVPESRARIWLTEEEARVHVVLGGASVAAGGRVVDVRPDQATRLTAGGVPTLPGPALENVLANADYRRPVSSGWIASTDGQAPAGEWAVEPVGGRSVVTLERSDSEGRPGNVSLKQDLSGFDLQDTTFLGISATLRIDHQDIVAGELFSEYPLILKLTSEPASGQTDDTWTLGFYGTDAVSEAEILDSSLGLMGVPVPFGQWVTFHSGNLLDPAGQGRLVLAEADLTGEPAQWPVPGLKRFEPPPRELLMFEVYASGHDYRSHVDRVGVWYE